MRLSRDERDGLRRFADVVRRELGLATESEAIAEAVRRTARDLNLG